MLDTLVSIKAIVPILGGMLAIYTYLPYVRDMVAGRTKPHPYTWLIWTVTQCIAAFGVAQSDSIYVAANLWVVTCFVFGVFLFSIRRGFTNITTFDTVCLIGASISLVFWLFANDLFTAVMLATFVDFLGYLPTVRRTWLDPSSESAYSWGLFVIATVLALFGVNKITLMSSAYLIMSASMNALITSLALRSKSWR